MEDQELKELIRQIGIWFFVLVVFGGMFTFILVKKFGSQDISVNKIIDQEETLNVLVLTKDVKNVQEIKYTLNTYGVKYEIVYKDRERYYDDFLYKISLMDRDVTPPSLIHIENKEATAVLNDIKNMSDLQTFIEYNNLSGEE